MGSAISSKPKWNLKQVDLTHFDVQRVIGKGGFGKVNAVIKISQPMKGQWFAMKALKKNYICDNNGYKEVFWEMEILRDLNHPFICNVHYAFQDRKYLYLVMDVALGGDMRYVLFHSKDRHFSEDAAKIYIASVIIALEYCHSLLILHRDIKPENILMDSEGFLKLTDFGLAAKLQSLEDNCTQRSGTHGYMAPEIYSHSHEHGVPSEAFSVGVMTHEFLCGFRPYSKSSAKHQPVCSSSRHEAQKGGFGDSVSFLLERKEEFSSAAIQFTAGLLQMEPQLRLGSSGMQQLKEHAWFEGFDWERLGNHQLQAPFKPNTSRANCDTGALDLLEGVDEEMAVSAKSIADSLQEKFNGYELNLQLVL